MTPSAIPNLKAERELFDGGAPMVLACDEVGRGALAGPVTVGLVLIDASVRRMPAGLRDSKLMTEPRREAMAPACGGVGARLGGGRGIRRRDRRARHHGVPRARGRPRLRGPDRRPGGCARRAAPARRQLRLAEPVDRAPRARDHAHQGRPRLRVGGGGIRDRQGASRPAGCGSRTRTSRCTAGTRTRGTRAAATSRPSPSTVPSALHRHTWLHERPEEALTLFDLGVG